MINHFLLASLGGAIGAGARYWVGVWALRLLGPGFPWGTLFVNIVGSLLMGLIIGLFAKISGLGAEWRVFLATGVLGGFTTFSAFSLDAISLWERGDFASFASYVLASVVLSFAALFAGLLVMRGL